MKLTKTHSDYTKIDDLIEECMQIDEEYFIHRIFQIWEDYTH